LRWQKQVFMHTRLSRDYLELARLSCISGCANVRNKTDIKLFYFAMCDASGGL